MVELGEDVSEIEAVYKKAGRKEKAMIERKVKKFFRKYRCVKGVIIFGSFVGRRYFKDVDIAIITDRKVGPKAPVKMEVEMERDTGVEVDIKMFNELPMVHGYEILSSGKQILISRTSRNIMRETVKEYEDFRVMKGLNEEEDSGNMSRLVEFPKAIQSVQLAINAENGIR